MKPLTDAEKLDLWYEKNVKGRAEELALIEKEMREEEVRACLCLPFIVNTLKQCVNVCLISMPAANLRLFLGKEKGLATIN